jgi:hypothetical protein
MESLVSEVEKNVDGRRVMIEGEDDEEVVMQRYNFDLVSHV